MHIIRLCQSWTTTTLISLWPLVAQTEVKFITYHEIFPFFEIGLLFFRDSIATGLTWLSPYLSSPDFLLKEQLSLHSEIEFSDGIDFSGTLAKSAAGLDGNMSGIFISRPWIQCSLFFRGFISGCKNVACSIPWAVPANCYRVLKPKLDCKKKRCGLAGKVMVAFTVMQYLVFI